MLRLGLWPLNSSAFNSTSPRDATACCQYCNEFENEKHLIRFCPVYDNITARYLNGVLIGRQPSSNILRCDIIPTARSLGACVFYAFRIREKYVESMVTVENDE